MRLNYLARAHPKWTIDEIGISTLEHKALYIYAQINVDSRLKFDPIHPPSIKDFVFTIARLGGFTNFPINLILD